MVIFAVPDAAMVVGALQVRNSPGIWSVIIAVVITALVLGELVITRRFSTHAIWGSAIAFALWCVVPLAFRVESLLEEHPELYIAQKWKGRRTGARRTVRADQIHAETIRQKRAARKKALIFGGAFVLFAVAVWFVPKGKDRAARGQAGGGLAPRPEFDTRGIDFMAAWNSGGWPAIERFLHPDDRRRLGSKIRRLMKKRGWDKRRPRLKPPRIEDKGKIRTYYAFEEFEPDIELVVRWAHDRGQWWYDRGKWPRTEDVKR